MKSLNRQFMPYNLTVGGDLDLYGTPITELPDNLTLGGHRDLRGTLIAALPEIPKITGRIIGFHAPAPPELGAARRGATSSAVLGRRFGNHEYDNV